MSQFSKARGKPVYVVATERDAAMDAAAAASGYRIRGEKDGLLVWTSKAGLPYERPVRLGRER